MAEVKKKLSKEEMQQILKDAVSGGFNKVGQNSNLKALEPKLKAGYEIDKSQPERIPLNFFEKIGAKIQNITPFNDFSTRQKISEEDKPNPLRIKKTGKGLKKL